MARKMWDGQPEKAVYRTVISQTMMKGAGTWLDGIYIGRDADQEIITHYGPYSTIGAARAVETNQRKKVLRHPAYRKGLIILESWVEVADTKWHRVPPILLAEINEAHN